MFEQTLIDKFKKIFEIERVTYDSPAHDDVEQETLFLEVSLSKNIIRDGKAQARVQGKGIMFAEWEKLPYGFFSKAIDEHPTDAKDLFFFDLEENSPGHNNLVKRGFSFIYFFNSQYDPAIGTITSLTSEVETT